MPGAERSGGCEVATEHFPPPAVALAHGRAGPGQGRPSQAWPLPPPHLPGHEVIPPFSGRWVWIGMWLKDGTPEAQAAAAVIQPD